MRYALKNRSWRLQWNGAKLADNRRKSLWKGYAFIVLIYGSSRRCRNAWEICKSSIQLVARMGCSKTFSLNLEVAHSSIEKMDFSLNSFCGFHMKCHRCGSVMVYEKFYGPHERFFGWRCILCGEIVDQVILENRQTKSSRQGGGRRRECNT